MLDEQTTSWSTLDGATLARELLRPPPAGARPAAAPPALRRARRRRPNDHRERARRRRPANASSVPPGRRASRRSGPERREPVPRVVVEREHAPAEVVGAVELEARVRVRRVGREEDSAGEEQAATSSGIECTGAIASSQSAKPVAPSSIVRQRARAIAAADERADSAPAPKPPRGCRTCAARRRASASRAPAAGC